MEAAIPKLRFPKGNLIISRTDAIGDVILTLPLASYLKSLEPGRKIIFLGRNYTKAIIEACPDVDIFANWDDISGLSKKEQTEMFKSFNANTIIHVFPKKEVAFLAKKAGIKIRIGTSHRWYHWLYCNYLPSFTRRNANAHEAALNFMLLKPFGFKDLPSKEELNDYCRLQLEDCLSDEMRMLPAKDKYNIVLHPLSKGSAREWGFENYLKLISLLPEERFRIFISGTTTEASKMERFLKELPGHVIDITGKTDLKGLMAFINACDAIVACSTGPLHIGAALGKIAIGIYPPIRPMHPGRWAPLGDKAKAIVVEKACNDCRKGGLCRCIMDVSPTRVACELLSMLEN